jgi:hypothetical protein
MSIRSRLQTGGQVDGITYAKTALQDQLALVTTCAADMDDAQYNWKPGGTANSAAKSHVHAVTSVDFFINGIVRGEALMWGAFAKEHGLAENPMGIWTFEGNVPVGPMREYAASVHSAAVEYIGSLKDADLDREIETNFFGRKPVSFLVQLAGYHAVGHGGDIATVKGMQGLKGLPF